LCLTAAVQVSPRLLPGLLILLSSPRDASDLEGQGSVRVRIGGTMQDSAGSWSLRGDSLAVDLHPTMSGGVDEFLLGPHPGYAAPRPAMPWY
jgi:hypothetical protein